MLAMRQELTAFNTRRRLDMSLDIHIGINSKEPQRKPKDGRMAGSTNSRIAGIYGIMMPREGDRRYEPTLPSRSKPPRCFPCHTYDDTFRRAAAGTLGAGVRGVSINQFALYAFAKELGALETSRYFTELRREKSKQDILSGFDEVMATVPVRKVPQWDRLCKGESRI